MFFLDFKEEKCIFWPEDGSNKWMLAHVRQTAWCHFQSDLLINPKFDRFENLKYRVCLFNVF